MDKCFGLRLRGIRT